MAKIEQLIDRAISSLPLHSLQMLEYDKTQGKRPVVFVGMSGGVDSSVSAYLLQRAGFDVRGVFIKVWQPKDMVCTWKDDRRDAMRVAAMLGIPFQTINLEKEYKKYVADYMITEYASGRTPNPDIMCNKYVKFGAFYEAAMTNGADFVATGHYARSRTVGSIYHDSFSAELLTARDEAKDQTYFLWAMKGERVARTLFPVGILMKEEVRMIAEYVGLPVYDKKDSQGVCFIGKLDMKEFLGQYIKKKEGKVVDLRGKEIGRHNGAFLYTIGERHGFELFNQTPDMEAHFIIKKDIPGNILTVGTQAELIKVENAKEAILGSVNLISKENTSVKYLKARIRHRQKLQQVQVGPATGPDTFSAHELHLKVSFKEAQQGLAPGQSCVLYDGEICLGGGIIN